MALSSLRGTGQSDVATGSTSTIGTTRTSVRGKIERFANRTPRMAQNTTDGQIALIVNKVFRSLTQLYKLADRYSPEVAMKREIELRARIEALIAEVDGSVHIAAQEIAANLRDDYQAGRTKYIAAGARRFFNLPLNWIILDGEVKMQAAVETAKMQAKAIAKARKQQRRLAAPTPQSRVQSLPESNASKS